MRQLTIALLGFAFALPAPAQDVAEPRSGVLFPAKMGGMSLLGVGLRTKTFLKVKVYAVGLYVADSAWDGPLAVHKGKVRTSALYRDLVSGDFEKQIVLKFVRDVTANQIQGAFREDLTGLEKTRVDAFVLDFPDTKTGQEYILRWAPGDTLEVTVAGQAKPPIPDKSLAAAVFGIWLGEKPIQEDIKRDLVSRASAVAN